MKQASTRWLHHCLSLSSAAMLTAFLSGCGTPDSEEPASSESSVVSSTPSSSEATTESSVPVPTSSEASSESSVPASVSSVASEPVASSSSSAAPVVVPQNISFQDMCDIGFTAHETDGSLPDEPYAYVFDVNGGQETDALVRPEIMEWMEQHSWQESHALWHDARRCGAFGGFGGFGGVGAVDVCSVEDRPAVEENECAGPQDGYEFLVMHRHMFNTLKSLWPSLEDQFAGFDGFPTIDDYPEYLKPYFQEWNPDILNAAQAVDLISDPDTSVEDVLARWPNEKAFGQWIQCGDTTGGPSINGIHGGLHFNAYPPNSEHSIASVRRNLDAYIFWKLHGYIDNAWEAYRQKIGKTTEDDELKAELIAQCKEHYFWAEKVDPNLLNYNPGALPTVETETASSSISSSISEEETGYFATIVKPAISVCVDCHAPWSGPSAQAVANLVDVDSVGAEGYKLVVPGDPESSWLYIKASTSTSENVSVDVVCTGGGTSCAAGMYRDNFGDVAEVIRQWILDGAPVE